MSVIHADQSRRSETPNAVMTTLASPTLGGSALALWRVEMTPGAVGPEHRFDVEQIWTLVAGAGDVVIEGLSQAVGPGDTVVLRAGELRQVRADAVTGLQAFVVAPGQARAILADGTDRGVPPWIA
ncbi:MAG: cupin domain-containing protein [Brevundimonas sp.]|nr:MAG: cupin domain-containing protein [Brevundimonas sp.]